VLVGAVLIHLRERVQAHDVIAREIDRRLLRRAPDGIADIIRALRRGRAERSSVRSG
jgi:hypothetical protein